MTKQERSGVPANTAELKFPSLVEHDLAFGENPFYQLNSPKFEYSFIGEASQKFVYYTMSIYQHNWGLTAYKKSEYQIRITADVTSKTNHDDWKKTQPIVGASRTSRHATQSTEVPVQHVEAPTEVPSSTSPAPGKLDWLQAPTQMLNNALQQVDKVNMGLADLVNKMSG